MNRHEVFHMEYPTGYMDINVGTFFGAGPNKNIRAFLKLARQHCVDSQRTELIEQMQKESAKCDVALDICADLERRRKNTLNALFADRLYIEQPLPSPERALVKRRDRLNQYVEDLQKERWDA